MSVWSWADTPQPTTATSAKPIIVALDADMSAVAKEGGIAIQRGAEIAIRKINAAGGILGRPVELKVYDHRGNPARGIANIKKIAKTENVLAVLGGVHTPVVLQELPLIHENKLLFMAPWSAGTPIIDNGYEPNFVFRVSVRDQEAGKVLIGAAKEAGLAKVGLLLERTGWGRSNLKSMTAAAEKNGVSITSTQWVNWKQKDMSAEISAITDSGAEAIMLVANAPEGAVAITEIAKNPASKRLRVYAHWGLAGGAFVKMTGQAVLDKVELAILQSYSFASPHNQMLNDEVVNLYQEMFDSSATAQSIPGAVGVAHSYDILWMLKTAAEKAGSIESEAVRLALEDLGEFKGLVKDYKPPFTAERHDALWSPDYFLSSFDSDGQLLPIERNGE